MADHFSHENRKRTGVCCISGEIVWEHAAIFDEGHHNAGDVRHLKAPAPTAVRVTLILVSGALCSITVHEDHIEEVERNLPEIWRANKAAIRHGRVNHRGNGQQSFTPAQNAFMDEQNLAMFDDVPLGILCYENWSDLDG